jgi:sortase A
MSRVAAARIALAAALACAGLSQVAAAGWIHAKAILAQQLIATAWDDARHGGAARAPWPWADMRPIARMTIPSRNIDLFILDSTSPRALAFGPGYVSGTALPASSGNSVIVAHRDTHFAFLRTLAADDEIEVESLGGRHARYRVREVAIVDKGDARVLDEADSAQLTLITCYPFDAIRPGTTLRYIVIAARVA